MGYGDRMWGVHSDGREMLLPPGLYERLRLQGRVRSFGPIES